jgi:hypothetical protein
LIFTVVVDNILRQEHDNSTIGLISCQTHERVAAEYILRNVQPSISISEYELTYSFPDNPKVSLSVVSGN